MDGISNAPVTDGRSLKCASGDAPDSLERLGTIHGALFTRPNNFDKTGRGTFRRTPAPASRRSRRSRSSDRSDRGNSRGTSGRQIQLVANFVPLTQQPDLFCTQYHVEFDPQLESKSFRLQILKQEQIQEQIGTAFIFDGMILYIVSDRNFDGVYPAVHPLTKENVTVRLRASVSCLDIVGLKRLGRNHFDENEKAQLRDYEMEVWPGFETAVRQYEDQLMLCIENRFKMIRTQSVWEIMCCEYERVKGDEARFHTVLEESLVGETVFARYNNKMYRISSINYEMSPESTFTLVDGTETTLRGYFLRQYDLEVKADGQPVLISEGKPKQPGEAPQVAYLLPELVYPTGLTDSMRRDFRHMRELSSHTRLDPEKRRRTTEKLLDKIIGNEKCCSLMRNWGISLHNRLVNFMSRELEPEKLFGHHPGGYTGQRAEWAKDWSAAGYYNAVQEAIARAGNQSIHMMVLILADDSKTRYDMLKSWLCTETTIPSQFIQLSTLRGRPQDRGRNKNFGSIVLKIVLQMNCKMGGALWKVAIPLKKAMIVGYDLYHDSTLRGKTIGACVSTMDQDYTKFYSQTRPHENPTELGTNLGFFIRKALYKYYTSNNRTLPEKIFLYRDGVGDGQIPYVKDQEVILVQQACAEAVQRAEGIAKDFKIKLAFIIVTKKVNMRIFKGNPNSTLTNPDPGTVVDSVVTRPERYDFYLVPQYVNQGTVTPVCYNIIYDDTDLSPDKHHKLAFKLCHLYYNWQGTVRVPAPCQYAHKLAFLVAQSIHKEANQDLRDKLFFL
ncbi:piwi domain protein [Ancylostoma ceylanicum]|uniref:Piwi domain protein n=1 Tax=Ancylostoma ceylanicum TaxID=53326 RepID=A0A0D6L9T4_9BILA|nr:piwi domain protein [Ancylostoma ceylanicum]